jgi:hypothetical protein
MRDGGEYLPRDSYVNDISTENNDIENITGKRGAGSRFKTVDDQL